MLVLSRREGEHVSIDGHITVKVIQIAGGRVRLGIDAPREVLILRGELPVKQEWGLASSAAKDPSALAFVDLPMVASDGSRSLEQEPA